MTTRIDYHVHTCWSYDSRSSLQAIIDRALDAGLTGLAVTDHDTIDGAIALGDLAPRGLDVVVGCEFTTNDGSQVIGLHLTEMIAEASTLDLMARIREQGGLVLLPHPFRRGSGIFRPDLQRSAAFVERALELTSLVECHNGRDSHDNNARSLDFVTRHGLAAVSGSDAHTPREVGSVFVEFPSGDEASGAMGGAVYFPDRPGRSEPVLKRRVMELYHRHERRLPAVVGRSYRAARRRSGLEGPPSDGLPPRRQYVLPVPIVASDAP